MARSEATLYSRLIRAGFDDAGRAERFLADLDGHAELLPDGDESPELLKLLAAAANPDGALLGLLNFVETLERTPEAATGFADSWRSEPQLSSRLISIFGASAAMADHLMRHPASWRELSSAKEHVFLGTADSETAAIRHRLVSATGADPAALQPTATLAPDEAQSAMRAEYRTLLMRLAADDLSAPDPSIIVPDVARVLADLAGAALDAGLAIARADVGDAAADVTLAVIGMGKCGGRELNYVSDVDVIFVAEAARPDVDPHLVSEVGAKLASKLSSVCAEPAAEPALWVVDAALRPEGKKGALVKTLDEHLHYYDTWADNWEFQALLKARPIAGDRELGTAYYDAINPLVWQASSRKGFVESVQKMRLRVTDNIPDRELPQQLKLGPGGLRDVEFSAQLLQMVHGRVDDQLRVANTWQALERLSSGGYIGRDDTAELDVAYRFLRVVEHRLQLSKLQRTHLVPKDEDALRRLARAVYPDGSGERTGEQLEKQRKAHGRSVRALHEQIFYRPVLAMAAKLTGEEAKLSFEGARDRLFAFGYRDPEGAIRHLTALTSGLSRRAAIQRHLLPVLLDWLSQGVDPDAGLLAFRKLSDGLGTSHWYLKMLRDSGVAAQRMTRILSVSRFVTDLLETRPTAVAWLDDDAALQARTREGLDTEIGGSWERHRATKDSITMIRSISTREVLRIAIRDVLRLADPTEIARELSLVAELSIEHALRAVRDDVEDRYRDKGTPLPDYRFAIVAMGSLGGREIGYTSDADVLFVYDVDETEPGADLVGKAVAAIGSELTSALKEPREERGIVLDAGLRPEGKQGILVRTLTSYARYYEQWSEPWEAQALLRARPIAGDESLGAEYINLIDPLRYPETMSEGAVMQMRRLKARMESERLPRGADPNRHLKLGRGGLSDVEWVAQLLQMRNAHTVVSMRRTETLATLNAAVEHDLLDPADRDVLSAAWIFASRVRNAAVLWRGRVAQSLPTDRLDLEAVARLLGYPADSAVRLEDDYLRSTRQARRVVERIFF
ncbi:bifunctional [glutamine synthetase] adenylyltransferase/[glutamine synthetase]-adenylyl-L-tyrosine phosphorylase [Saxibacter everestensis]|uniref:Bifunctional [glutamine synthetase] adenylyltransferase/[glutamine synthetase]-adenylyl-L-tyrosine phosphorylase n=1 Tax=Saxibacter everestensis TaxID=2909229 RepID=A0ABY8QWQ6_9MICO|nr:bifunctional [glutamine synthetase] adenylyltransferase/[glutamine synthetase]-adenylyl-L-tyrosine phosphorylase [Brevibacteriaceae bacterium ZFBP1038]